MNLESSYVKIPEHENLDYHEILLASYYEWLSAQPESYSSYRFAWASGEQLPSDVPLHLDIEPTNMCNLKCTMCPRTEMVKEGSFWDLGYFPIDKYKQIISEFALNGGASIKFNYLGEPLLSSSIYQMIELASHSGIVDIMLNTNGTLLTGEVFRRLIQSGLTKLFISFDGANAETYNRIRVGADFDKVLTNILPLKKLRAKMGSINPLIRVSCTLVDQDISEQRDEFVKLFTPYVDAIGFGEITHGWETGPNDLADLIASERNEVPGFVCPDVQKRMFVHPDGVVTACCYDSRRKLVYGNINSDSLRDIWHSPQRSAIIKAHQDLNVAELEPCNTCMYLLEHLKPGAFA